MSKESFEFEKEKGSKFVEDKCEETKPDEVNENLDVKKQKNTNTFNLFKKLGDLQEAYLNILFPENFFLLLFLTILIPAVVVFFEKCKFLPECVNIFAAGIIQVSKVLWTTASSAIALFFTFNTIFMQKKDD
ncbi:MAG: hypothetical protein ACRC4W_06015 [Treponemataceae bacterium]